MHVMLSITSPQNPTLKLIRSLADKKHRQETGLFVAEGPKVLSRARDLGWEPDYLLSTEPLETWGKAACLKLDAKTMASISSQANPPTVVGVFEQRWSGPVQPTGLWLALEDIRDPGNLGTIIRTAEAAGASGVILAGHCCDPFAPDCVRATMGSIFAVPMVKHDRKAFLDLLRIWPGETVGTSLSAANSYRRTYREPLLIVMGSEGTGLTPETEAACATLVRIPMRGNVQSLNVAIATGLMLFEATAL